MIIATGQPPAGGVPLGISLVQSSLTPSESVSMKSTRVYELAAGFAAAFIIKVKIKANSNKYLIKLGDNWCNTFINLAFIIEYSNRGN